jgi:hypothetical protein
MSKTIIIRLTCAGNRTGPFDIVDSLDNVLGTDITKNQLITGVSYVVENDVFNVAITSKGRCKNTIIVDVEDMTIEEIAAATFIPCNTANLWRHLTDTTIYNKYYGNTEPYIIEYPFAYQSYDEILQNVKDYTKVYQYLPIPNGVFNDNARIEIDNGYFNKAVLYNGQQSTGVLELVPKPINNLSSYLSYPIYNELSKTITYTKSDNFYQYNTFWGLVKNKSIPLFSTSCESLSIDKIVNQANMDYGKRSFKKEPLRAKELKVRHILDNRSDIHLLSQFIITPSQISYK